MRTNYVTNPSIETATTGWYRTDTCVGTAAITRVSGGQVGDYALQFAYTAEASDATGTATQYCSPTAVGTAAQGDKWTVSAYVKKGAGTTSGVTVTLRIAYYNEAGVYIGQVSGADIFSSLTTSFQRFSYTGTLPADGAISRVDARLVCSSIAYGDAFDLVSDAWLLEKVDGLDDYFDGSTADTDDWDYEWAGTAHASLSTATPALYAPELVAYQSGLNIVVEWTQGPEYIDVSEAPYSIDKTGATSVTGALDGADGVLATIRDAGAIAYFPAGTYLLSTALTVPDGCHLAGPLGLGPGACAAWLQGTVVYNSNSTLTDLKIGDLGADGIRNGASASTTTFTRCQFRGGAASYRAPLKFGGGTNDADHITFTDCNVERNLGNHESDGASGYNNVIWIEAVGDANGSHMEYITFDGCHFGVDNGRRDIARSIGAPRANVELYQLPGAGAVRTGWHNVYFYDCIFEAADGFTLDIPGAIYDGVHTDGYCVIDGCTIYGGGVTEDWFPSAIVIEGVNHVTINDCDIYPAHDNALTIQTYGGVDTNNWAVTGNRFHLDDFTHGGIDERSTEPAIILQGTGEFTGNTIHNSTGSYWLLWLGYYYSDSWADGCTITGNEFHELRSTVNPMLRVYNATDCTITGNTFQTAATSGPTLTYSGTNTGTTVVDGTNNTLVHG